MGGPQFTAARNNDYTLQMKVYKTNQASKKPEVKCLRATPISNTALLRKIFCFCCIFEKLEKFQADLEKIGFN